MKKLSSFAMVMIATVALMATPVLAQNAPPSGMQNMPSGGMQGGDKMHGTKMAKPAKKGMAKHASTKTAMKHSCMDYAWQSQDQKDCEAGTKKPPTGR